MKKLNKSEEVVLVAITKSEYQNHNNDETMINFPVWSFSVGNYNTSQAGITGKQISGYVSSLKKKGYVGCDRDTTNACGSDDNCVWITKKGFEYLKNNNLLN